MDQKLKAEIMYELLKASLEIDRLKPHVSQMQLDAANRLKANLGKINELLESA